MTSDDSQWRFRASTFGTIILQKLVSVDGPSEEWRDANVMDMVAFVDNNLRGKYEISRLQYELAAARTEIELLRSQK
jgi:hypothetical protein